MNDDIDWVSIELDYRMGTPSAELAQQYGVPEAEIKAAAIDHSWLGGDGLTNYMQGYKYRAYVEAFITNGFNNRKALESAGYVSKMNMLQKPEIRALIEKRMKDIESISDVTRQRVLSEFAKLAFYDPADIFEDDGTAKSMGRIPKDIRHALTGVKVTRDKEGNVTREYKLADKKATLDSIAKHLGMFTEKVELNANVKSEELTPAPDDAAKRIAFLFAKALKGTTEKD